MKALDWAVLVGYGLGVLAAGWYFRRQARAGEGFYLAGRRLRALPLGLSVMITLFSAVNFSAFPSEVIEHGLYVLVSVPVFLPAAWIAARWAVPFYRRQGEAVSAYAWLGARYGIRVRALAAWLFMCWRLAWMATALFATGTLMEALLGIPSHGIMAVAALTAVVYTSLGGLRAVVWTDVGQFLILGGGLLWALFYARSQAPQGWGALVGALGTQGVLQPWVPGDRSFFSWNPAMRISLVSGVAGTLVAFVARYAADQMVVQRYLAASSERAARKAVWVNAWAAVVALTLLAGLGLAAAFAAGSLPGSTPMGVLATYFKRLPAGLTGLLAAGLLAATMSSLDSGIHACATVWAVDVRPAPGGLRRSLPVLWAWGFLALACAWPLGRLGGLFAVVNRVVNGLGSPLLALVLLGAFPTASVHARGLFWGGIAGALLSMAVSFRLHGLALHYYAVVNFLLTLLCCLLGSLLPEKADP